MTHETKLASAAKSRTAEEHTLINGILARPGDDDARLAYAAFLEAKGDRQSAELIRLDCLRASLSPIEQTLRHSFLVDDVEALSLSERGWVERQFAEQFPKYPRGSWVLTRGLLEGVSWSYAAEERTRAWLSERYPFVRELWVTLGQDALECLNDAPWLDRYERLCHVGGGAKPKQVERAIDALLASPHLGNIRSLSFSWDTLGDILLAAIAHATTLPRLAHLSVEEYKKLTPLGVATLVASPLMSRLESLSLRLVKLGDAGAKAFVTKTANAPKNLRALDLDENRIGPHGVHALVRSGVLGTLEQLSLRKNPIGDQGANMLAAGVSPKLTRLALDSAKIGPIGAGALAGASSLSKLRSLSMGGCTLGDQGFANLAMPGKLPSLRELDVNNAKIGAGGVSAMSEPGSFDRLEWLCFHGNKLGPKAMPSLARACLPRIRGLDLSVNPIGDDGANVLATAAWLERVEVLLLRSCRIGAAGAKAFFATAKLPAIRELRLDGNHIGDDGIAALAAFAPLARLERLVIDDMAVGPRGLALLTQSDGIMSLRRLSIGRVPLAPHDIGSIFVGSKLHSLTHLSLKFTSLRVDSLRALASWPGLAQLRELDLSYNNLGDAEANALLAWPGNLFERLDLSTHSVSPELCEQLTKHFSGARVVLTQAP